VNYFSLKFNTFSFPTDTSVKNVLDSKRFHAPGQFLQKDQEMSRKRTRNLTEKNKVFQRETQGNFRKDLVLF